jgi:hypothetical protein
VDAGASAQGSPLTRWELLRKEFPDAPPGPVSQDGTIRIKTEQGYEYNESFLNCNDDAFRKAAETLENRAKVWGKNSPYLLDWLHAQDVVFSNCSSGSAAPSAAPAGSPLLLTQDRAYQTAAAHFYGRDFQNAAAEFVAISKDRSSPWQQISGYVAARVLIRQAFFVRTTPEPQSDFDPALMQSAASQLRAYLAGGPPPAFRRAAEAQLALVRIRTEPEARARELAEIVGGPSHDANYAQDMQDLLWVTNAKTPEGLRAHPSPWVQIPDAAHPGQMRTVTPEEAVKLAAQEREAAYEGSGPVRALSPMLDWAISVQSPSPAAADHALRQWRSTHTLAWMAAALMLTHGDEGKIDDLLKAAARVPSTSPAWQTILFHRARCLLASGHAAEARNVLADFSSKLDELPAAQRPPSSVNALRGMKMLAAPTEAEFLSFVPRTMLLATSEESSSVSECQEAMKNPARHYNCVHSIDPDQMDADSASVLNEQAPLSVWLSAAQSTSLPSQLRTAIAVEGWTRAVLLEDKEKAAAFLPLLPEALRSQAGEDPALGAWMTLVRNPGLRPYVNGGIQRAYSYDFVESYRDNWCYRREEGPSLPATAVFLTSRQEQQGAEEARRLASLRVVSIGEEIVRGVKADTQNPQAAEALFLILRMIRYGCVEAAPVAEHNPGVTPTPESQQLLALKREAARLLRQHYAGSTWTRKAAPFAG